MSKRGPKVRVAAIQMVSAPEVAANLAAAGRLIAEAAAAGAQLVALGLALAAGLIGGASARWLSDGLLGPTRESASGPQHPR